MALIIQFIIDNYMRPRGKDDLTPWLRVVAGGKITL